MSRNEEVENKHDHEWKHVAGQTSDIYNTSDEQKLNEILNWSTNRKYSVACHKINKGSITVEKRLQEKQQQQNFRKTYYLWNYSIFKFTVAFIILPW
jgi:hypothetical protein